MEDMLHAVDDGGPVGVLGDLHDPLHPQQLWAVRGPQQVLKQGEALRADGLVGGEGMGADRAVMPVHVAGLLIAR